MAEPQAKRWVGSWTMAPVAMEGPAFAGESLRMIAHVSLGGDRLRVRFSNAFGRQPLTIGRSHIALRAEGAAIRPGSDRALTFGGEPSVTIAAGALAVTDPVSLDLPPSSDVAVTLHLPDPVPEDFAATGHRTTHQTNYISPPGDFCGAESMPVAKTSESWYFLTGIELLAPASTRGLVAFGDSLTDGNLSSLDANNRWPDQLARRLQSRPSGPSVGIMNQGIGGNRLLRDGRGDSGLKRFDRDVLAQSGVTHVILLLGTNDLRNRHGAPEEEATAAGLIAGLQQIGVRARTHGLTIFAGTLLPYENETFFPGAWTPAREAVRQAVNRWLRASGEAFDGIIDFDAALRDPAHPSRLLAAYDCGDHLHPGDAGYRKMGDSIDLLLFG
jgi:lysophospholipase L1-like esterase